MHERGECPCFSHQILTNAFCDAFSTFDCILGYLILIAALLLSMSSVWVEYFVGYFNSLQSRPIEMILCTEMRDAVSAILRHRRQFFG